MFIRNQLTSANGNKGRLMISLKDLDRDLLSHVRVFLESFRALKLDRRMHWTIKVQCSIYCLVV